jgi:hypothetical protein
MSTRTQELAHRPKIKTIQDAVRRVREFNEQMQDRIHDLRASVGGTAFWVYEPITGDFAPSSFCRFAAVTVLEYVQKGAGFQSAPRDSVIPLLLGGFSRDETISHKLAAWREKRFGPDKSPRKMAGTFVEACVLPEAELADQEAPDSLRDQEDQRERTWQEIVLRRGQQEFRQHLLVRYGFRCQMTGCDVTDVLEAAHIIPYRGRSSNHVDNGLLLRSDIHILFDLCLVSVDPDTLQIARSRTIRSYPELVPALTILNEGPSRDALRRHWDLFRACERQRSRGR